MRKIFAKFKRTCSIIRGKFKSCLFILKGIFIHSHNIMILKLLALSLLFFSISLYLNKSSVFYSSLFQNAFVACSTGVIFFWLSMTKDKEAGEIIAVIEQSTRHMDNIKILIKSIKNDEFDKKNKHSEFFEKYNELEENLWSSNRAYEELFDSKIHKILPLAYISLSFIYEQEGFKDINRLYEHYKDKNDFFELIKEDLYFQLSQGGNVISALNKILYNGGSSKRL